MVIDKKRIPQVLKPFYEKYLELHRVNEAWKLGKIEEAFFKSWPIKVFVEPTNRCLMDCVYCARKIMKRPLGDMSLDTFKTIIEKLPKGIQIQLLGQGEPLLHTKLPEMIKIAVEKDLIVVVITNAAALHRKNIEAILESGLHRLQISIDTIFPAVFEKLTGNKVKFKVVWNNLLEFLYHARIKKQVNIFVTISAVLVDEVKKDLSFLRWFWRKLPVDNFYEGPLLSMQVYSGLYKKTVKKIYIPYKPCVNPWISAIIHYNGDVNVCPLDIQNSLPVGNVISSDFMEVINSKRAQRLREAILKKDTEFFEDCGYYCHKCNAWHPEVEHSIEDWVNGYLPLLSGLTLVETTVKRTYSPETLEFLEFLYRKKDSFSEVLEKLKRDFDAERKRDHS